MSDLIIFAKMIKQYNDDCALHSEFGEEIVSSEELAGERKMIQLVKRAIDENVEKMEAEHEGTDNG